MAWQDAVRKYAEENGWDVDVFKEEFVGFFKDVMKNDAENFLAEHLELLYKSMNKSDFDNFLAELSEIFEGDNRS